MTISRTFLVGFLVGVAVSSLWMTTLLLGGDSVIPTFNTKIDDAPSDASPSSSCLPWPKQQQSCTTSSSRKHPQQILLFALHPEKTAGSSIGRYLEVNEQTNKNNNNNDCNDEELFFELMSPYNETWFLLWIGDAHYRQEHPRVMVHIHGQPGDHTRPFSSRSRFVQHAKNLSPNIQRILLLNDDDNGDALCKNCMGYEYVLRILAHHARRFEQQTTTSDNSIQILALPHWREPGDHFVSSVLFLNNFSPQKLTAEQHAQQAMTLYQSHKHTWPRQRIRGARGWYEPEYLLRYYFGNNSPLIAALHSTTNDKQWQAAYAHVVKFLWEIQPSTIWMMSERLDEALLMVAHRAQLPRLYEPTTCLPLWDVLGTNTNPKRSKNNSTEEAMAAGMARQFLSPGAATLHPLLVQLHHAQWQRQRGLQDSSSSIQLHLEAILQARQIYSNVRQVPPSVLEQRSRYKLFLKEAKFGAGK